MGSEGTRVLPGHPHGLEPVDGLCYNHNLNWNWYETESELFRRFAELCVL